MNINLVSRAIPVFAAIELFLYSYLFTHDICSSVELVIKHRLNKTISIALFLETYSAC